MSDTPASLTDRHHFLLRRLHSLTGIIPIGAFLIEHLLTNSLTPWPKSFDVQVHWLHHMHYLLALEFIFIFIPLAFHALYGIAIAWQAKPNPIQYDYADNWRYTLQRITGWIAAAFIVLHLLHYRFAYLIGQKGYVELVQSGEMTPFNAAATLFGQGPTIILIVIYAIGVLASVYHFVNGICTFCITWGITISVESRRRVSIGAFGLGAILLVWGAMGLYGLAGGTRPADHEQADTANDHVAVVDTAQD